MGVFDIVSEIRAGRELDELSRRLARRTYGPLREANQDRAASMSPAEARGYLRAKARPIVTQEVAAALGTINRYGDWAEELLVDRVRDRVVRSVLSDLPRKLKTPAIRRAA